MTATRPAPPFTLRTKCMEPPLLDWEERKASRPMNHSVLCHERYPRMEEADPEEPILDGWYCGDGWCDGRCHFPALTLTRNGMTLRALGSQVASGAAWQPFRLPWTGSTVDVATIYDGDLDAVARLWWT